MADQPDANQTAARIVRESTAPHATDLPADIEAVWAEWSKGVGKVDERAMTLLRAAFEVGVEAGRGTAASSFGRMGGLVGGKLRAANLSKERRQEIAKKAARSRWGKGANGRAGET